MRPASEAALTVLNDQRDDLRLDPEILGCCPHLGVPEAPPARVSEGGAASQRSSIASKSRSASRAAPAPSPSTSLDATARLATSGGTRVQLTSRTLAADGQADLAGQLDGIRGDGDQQPLGEQLLDARLGFGERQEAQTPFDVSDRRTRGQPGEKSALAIGEGIDEDAEALLVLEKCRQHLGGRAFAGEVEIGLDLAANVLGDFGDQLGERPPQTQGVLPDRGPDAADRKESPVAAAPDQTQALRERRPPRSMSTVGTWQKKASSVSSAAPSTSASRIWSTKRSTVSATRETLYCDESRLARTSKSAGGGTATSGRCRSSPASASSLRAASASAKVDAPGVCLAVSGGSVVGSQSAHPIQGSWAKARTLRR